MDSKDPTNASWLNPIKTHLSYIQKIALSGTDLMSWNELDAALQKEIMRRNENTKETFVDTDRRHKMKRLLWQPRQSGS